MEHELSLSGFIDSSFLKEEKITGIYSKEKLFSRKNDVYKIEVESGYGIKQYVFKQYRGESRHLRIKNELLFYNLLGSNGLKVPNIYYSNEEIVVMEFMGDRTLLDYIIKEEKSVRNEDIPDNDDYFKKPSYLTGTLNYIYDFNKKLEILTGKSYILNDMNHRNFLLPDEKVCRVDFEDCQEGAVEEDMGKFIAFLLTYDPPFTSWKKSLTESMKSYCSDNMDVDISVIGREIEDELARMAERRK